MAARADVEEEIHTLCVALEIPLPPAEPTGEVEAALLRAFIDEGERSERVAAATVHRFCTSVLLADQGMSDAEAALELGCSRKSLQRARQDVARLAAGSQQLRAALLGDNDG